MTIPLGVTIATTLLSICASVFLLVVYVRLTRLRKAPHLIAWVAIAGVVFEFSFLLSALHPTIKEDAVWCKIQAVGIFFGALGLLFWSTAFVLHVYVVLRAASAVATAPTLPIAHAQSIAMSPATSWGVRSSVAGHNATMSSLSSSPSHSATTVDVEWWTRAYHTAVWSACIVLTAIPLFVHDGYSPTADKWCWIGGNTNNLRLLFYAPLLACMLVTLVVFALIVVQVGRLDHLDGETKLWVVLRTASFIILFFFFWSWPLVDRATEFVSSTTYDWLRWMHSLSVWLFPFASAALWCAGATVRAALAASPLADCMRRASCGRCCAHEATSNPFGRAAFAGGGGGGDDVDDRDDSLIARDTDTAAAISDEALLSAADRDHAAGDKRWSAVGNY